MAPDDPAEASRGKYKFAMVPELAFRDTDLAKSALSLRVFGWMCLRANRAGLCWEKQVMIASHLSVKPKRVYETTALLEGAGWITELEGKGSAKGGRTFRINRDFVPPPDRLGLIFDPAQRTINAPPNTNYDPVQRTINAPPNTNYDPVQRTDYPTTTDDKSDLPPVTPDEHKNRPLRRTDHATDQLSLDASFDVPKVAPVSRRTSAVEIDRLFDEWWRHVPLKMSRGQAEKAYRAALKITDPGTLLAGVMRWAAEAQHQKPQYVKYPATWLNGQCWLDETPTRIINGNNGVQNVSSPGHNGHRQSPHQAHAEGTALAIAAARDRKNSRR